MVEKQSYLFSLTDNNACLKVHREFWVYFIKPPTHYFWGKIKRRHEAEDSSSVPSHLCVCPGEIKQSKAKSSGMFWNGLMFPPFEVNSLSLGFLIRWPRSMAQTHRLPEQSARVLQDCTENEIKSLSSSYRSHFIPIRLLNLTQSKV